ncbi:Pr6Pr family membrane protein [Parerythrobacter aestuarii]|uniref:Pr6Pr family membrane protein n=1 Tax=Parerythrobacter aestuarii TaxID=3020909 RepID=UPI0024DE4D88|nr:Pr6Pr family membrane protein [Parerythrobacter aestuarii]
MITIAPSQDPMQPRVLAGIVALTAFGALAVQTTLGDGSVPENAAGLARFFTIWSNIGTAVVMALAASGRAIPRGVLAALVTALTVVAVVYWTLLATDHHPVGLDRYTNQVFHTIVPVAVLVWWFRFVEPAPAILPMVPAIMVPPLAYGAFAYLLGEFTGFYAYFFLDLPRMGWVNFLISNALLAAFFGMLGATLVAIKRAIWRGR